MRGKNKKPISEEQRERLREQLAKGRATAAANRAALKEQPRVHTPRARPATASAPDPVVSAYDQEPPAPGVDYDAAMGGRASDRGFAQELAAALGQLVHQGQATSFGPKPIPPALLQKRDAARDKMIALLEDYQEREIAPRYEIITPEPGGFFIDDVLIPTGETIDYLGIPNEGLRPVNRAATAVMDLFVESIGGRTPDLADQSYQAYLNRPRHAAVVGKRPEAPVLGTPRTLQNASVVVVEKAEGRYTGPRRVLGTVQPETPGQF